jgi:hypothetical protein
VINLKKLNVRQKLRDGILLRNDSISRQKRRISGIPLAINKRVHSIPIGPNSRRKNQSMPINTHNARLSNSPRTVPHSPSPNSIKIPRNPKRNIRNPIAMQGKMFMDLGERYALII